MKKGEPAKIAFSRRNMLALGLIAATFAAAYGPEYAQAALYRGGGNLIVINPPAVALTFSNLTGSASPADTNIYWFQLFKKGDIPDGQSPLLRVGGVSYQVQCDQVVTFNDGSLAGCKISLVSGSIDAGSIASAFISSQNVPITNTPSRTTADVKTIGARIRLTNVTNEGGGLEGSGTWVIDFNDAIDAGGIQLRTINAGIHQGEYEVVAYAYDEAAPSVKHTHLRGTGIFSRWTKGDTTAGAGQIRAFVDNGHMQSLADGLSTYAVCTGTTPSTALTSSGTVTFTVPAAQNFYVGQAITAVKDATGQYMWGAVTSYSGTSLVVTMVGKLGTQSATSWYLIPTPSRYTMNATLQTGGGAVDIRTIASVSCAHHSGFAIAGATGARDWTDLRTNIFVRQDTSYLVQTDMVAPWDTTVALTVSDADYEPATYSPMINGYVNSTTDTRNGMGYTDNDAIYNEEKFLAKGTNTGGDRESIGYWTGYGVRGWMSQSPNYMQTPYVRSLCARAFNVGFRNPSTWRVAVLNNGSDGAGAQYPGMGSNYPTAWQHTTNATQIADTLLACVGTNNGVNGSSGSNALIDGEHFPSCHFSVYLVCGEWEMLDMAKNDANQMVFTRNPGIGRNINQTISAVNYKFWGNTCDNGSNVRTPAWALGQLSQIARYLPDDDLDKQYFTDLKNTHLAAAKWLFTVYYPSFANLAPAFPSTGVPWFPRTPGSSTHSPSTLHSFMANYLLANVATEVKLGEGNADAIWYGNHLMKWHKGLLDRVGSALYLEAYYLGGMELDSSNNLINSLDRFGYWNTDGGGMSGGSYSVLVPTAGSDILQVLKQTGSLTAPATSPSAPTFRLPVNTRLRLPTVAALAGGSVANPTPPAEMPIGTTLYVVEDGIASVHTNVGGITSITTSASNYIKVSLTEGGPPITFSSSQPLGCSYVIESPQDVPVAEFTLGAGLSGPGSYGNLEWWATELADWAELDDAAEVNLAIEAVNVTYLLNVAGNPKENNPKIAVRKPLAA